MISGNVVLHGNAGVQAAASLEDGQVIIKGNAGGNAGNGLYGGSLLIEGDTERGLGTLAHGGVIRVNGKVEGFGRPAYEIDKNGGYDYSVSKVTIYNGDKLIIDKGKFNDGPSKGVTWD
jgi:formylmethanofuran dehydrogenase subunit C